VRKLLITACAALAITSAAQGQEMTPVEAVKLSADFAQCATVALISANHAPPAMAETFEGTARGGNVAIVWVMKQYGPEDWETVTENIITTNQDYVLGLYEGGGIEGVINTLGAKCGEVSKIQANIVAEWRANNYEIPE
jgi:hypothetical protein